MKTFSNLEFQTFEQLVKLNQPSLKKVMSNFLRKHYSKVIETKNFITAEGDIPIALCAHMDTVFSAPPSEVFFDRAANVIWSPQGLGADDRAGVFAIVQIIRSGLRPHIILTTDEEKGCLGASALGKLDCPFKELNYIIELDRRGSDDCVFYDCENTDFIEYVEQFGFVWTFGSFSDIVMLCPSWGMAGVNLSVGYRDEHSTSEILFVGQLQSTIAKVKNMLQETEIPYFQYIESTPYPYSDKWYDRYSFAYGYDFDDDPEVMKCERCKQSFIEEELIPVVMLDKTTAFYCPDCLVGNVAWCDVCNSAFQKYSPEAPDNGTCPICKELKGGSLLDDKPRKNKKRR